MTRPLLKILPGVVAVLITPSCSKDNDVIKEDNAALVTEQVITNRVFYLKVRNKTSLSKMTIANYNKEGESDLRFEKGDILHLEFDIELTYQTQEGTNTTTYTIESDPECISSDGYFEVKLSTFQVTSGEVDEITEQEWQSAAQNALTEMQNGIEDAASKYNVKLYWGDPIIFGQQSYYEYRSLSDMFYSVPRSADQSFTLKQDGDYCFIVFEGGSSKIVKINDKKLSNSCCYLVKPSTEITVEDGGTTKTIKTESGKLYYVRKKEGDIFPTLKYPDAGTIDEINL